MFDFHLNEIVNLFCAIFVFHEVFQCGFSRKFDTSVWCARRKGCWTVWQILHESIIDWRAKKKEHLSVKSLYVYCFVGTMCSTSSVVVTSKSSNMGFSRLTSLGLPQLLSQKANQSVLVHYHFNKIRLSAFPSTHRQLDLSNLA